MCPVSLRLPCFLLVSLLLTPLPLFAGTSANGGFSAALPSSASQGTPMASESSETSEGSSASSDASAASSAGSSETSEGSSDTSEASSASMRASAESSEASSQSSDSSESSQSSDPEPQDPAPDDNELTGVHIAIISATSATSLAVVAGAVVLTIFAVDHLTAELYLRNNAVALRHHLHRGAGESLEDLAHLAGISPPQYPLFAAALHRQRQDLLPFIEDPWAVDRSSTRAFLRAMTQILIDDPALSDALIAGVVASR